MKVKLLSRVQLLATPWTAAHQAPLSMGLSRQERWHGCHCLLQCMKVKSESEVAQSCPTPSDPMDCSPPGSSVHGTFQARALAWVPLPSPRWAPHYLCSNPLQCAVTTLGIRGFLCCFCKLCHVGGKFASPGSKHCA